MRDGNEVIPLPGGEVKVLRLSWQQIADRGVALAERMRGDQAQQLRRGILLGFIDRLYKEGLAARPLDPVNLEVGAGVVPHLRQLRVLRRHAERWMGEVQKHLPDAKNWKTSTRWDDWTELSIVTSHTQPLIFKREESSPTALAAFSGERDAKALWWIEICGPARPALVGQAWPPGPEGGLAIRVGFILADARSLSDGLAPLKQAFGTAPFPPRTFIRPWMDARARRGEIFCYHPFNPAEAQTAGQWLIQTLATQWEVVEDLFQKGRSDRDLLDDWNGINAYANMAALAIPTGSISADPIALSPAGEDLQPIPGVQVDPTSPSKFGHSGTPLDYRWGSRKGHEWHSLRWSCCGQLVNIEECSRTPGVHHPGSLRGYGSRSHGGGGHASWTCCGKSATDPGCTEGDPPPVVPEA